MGRLRALSPCPLPAIAVTAKSQLRRHSDQSLSLFCVRPASRRLAVVSVAPVTTARPRGCLCRCWPLRCLCQILSLSLSGRSLGHTPHYITHRIIKSVISITRCVAGPPLINNLAISPPGLKASTCPRVPFARHRFFFKER